MALAAKPLNDQDEFFKRTAKCITCIHRHTPPGLKPCINCDPRGEHIHWEPWWTPRHEQTTK